MLMLTRFSQTVMTNLLIEYGNLSSKQLSARLQRLTLEKEQRRFPEKGGAGRGEEMGTRNQTTGIISKRNKSGKWPNAQNLT